MKGSKGRASMFLGLKLRLMLGHLQPQPSATLLSTQLALHGKTCCFAWQVALHLVEPFVQAPTMLDKVSCAFLWSVYGKHPFDIHPCPQTERPMVLALL